MRFLACAPFRASRAGGEGLIPACGETRGVRLGKCLTGAGARRLGGRFNGGFTAKTDLASLADRSIPRAMATPSNCSLTRYSCGEVDDRCCQQKDRDDQNKRCPDCVSGDHESAPHKRCRPSVPVFWLRRRDSVRRQTDLASCRRMRIRTAVQQRYTAALRVRRSTTHPPRNPLGISWKPGIAGRTRPLRRIG